MPQANETLPWDEAKSHAQLYLERDRATTKEQQNALAPQEHRAFAREAVGDKPWLAASLAVAIPLYQAQKVITGKSRSDASLDQVTEAYKGIGEGVVNAIKKPWEEARDALKNFLGSPSVPSSTPPTRKSVERPVEAAKALTKRSSAEEGMAKAVVLSPEHQAFDESYSRRPSVLKELETEIARTKDPKIKAILQEHQLSLLGKK